MSFLRTKLFVDFVTSEMHYGHTYQSANIYLDSKALLGSPGG